MNNIGKTRVERRLNQLLLDTTLDVINYQNTYDKMKSVEEIKVELNKLDKLLHEEYVPDKDRYVYEGSYKALEWVLNGSKTKKEKLDSIPHSSREEIEKLIKGLNDTYYEQMSLEDFGVDLGGTNE